MMSGDVPVDWRCMSSSTKYDHGSGETQRMCASHDGSWNERVFVGTNAGLNAGRLSSNTVVGPRLFLD